MHLDNILCQIHPNRRNRHRGRLSCFVECRKSHYGTYMPIQVGTTIPLACTHCGRPETVNEYEFAKPLL